jgi:zinc transporter ZupT
MSDTPQRVQEFKEAVAELRVEDPATRRERQLLGLGVLLMIAGVAVAFVAYILSGGESSELEQREQLILAVFGASLAVVGGALFLRYSLARFFRYWLLRLIYELRERP